MARDVRARGEVAHSARAGLRLDAATKLRTQQEAWTLFGMLAARSRASRGSTCRSKTCTTSRSNETTERIPSSCGAQYHASSRALPDHLVAAVRDRLSVDAELVVLADHVIALTLGPRGSDRACRPLGAGELGDRGTDVDRLGQPSAPCAESVTSCNQRMRTTSSKLVRVQVEAVFPNASP